MLNTKRTFIERITLQKVGSKQREELNFLAKAEVALSDNEDKALKSFFLSSVKSSIELNKFSHHVSLEYNTMYDLTKMYFAQEQDFIPYSNAVLGHLYENSTHPQIKTGELFVVEFHDIEFNDIVTTAIGVFKIEKKLEFLNFNHREDGIDFIIDKGVKLQKIDKGCLIINTETDDGLRILSVDNNSYDASYWKNDFLGVEEVHNDSFQTKHYLNMISDFSANLVVDNDTLAQKDFINQTMRVFNENEFINNDILKEELLEPFEITEKFEEYKEEYKQIHNLDLEPSFNIEQTTLKKEKKKIKSEILLDTMIQIKIDANEIDTVKENIERGYDEEKRMHYYKVYFNEEL
ncbi:MAG: nucleoid-associated protein [Flavobacteriales bacterium]